MHTASVVQCDAVTLAISMCKWHRRQHLTVARLSYEAIVLIRRCDAVQMFSPVLVEIFSYRAPALRGHLPHTHTHTPADRKEIEDVIINLFF
jgi:hypothetical protein